MAITEPNVGCLRSLSQKIFEPRVFHNGFKMRSY